MNFKEFMKHYNLTEIFLKDILDTSRTSFRHYKNLTRSPSLLRALQLIYLSDNKLSAYELLSNNDKEKFRQWEDKMEKRVEENQRTDIL